MAKRVIRINVKLPNGVAATPELEAKVLTAANKAVNEFVSSVEAVKALAADLQRKGFAISPEELLERRSGKTKAPASARKTAGGKRTRVVLTDAQRNEVIEALRAGAKTAALVKKYGASPATITNIKAAAGLTKKRGSK